MGDYRKLRAWQAAKMMVVATYRVTERMPRDERFGLTAQIRRAAVSVVANLAEGAGRSGDRELMRYVSIARGSAQELICELELSEALGMIPEDVVAPVIGQARTVAALLSRLHDALGAERPPFSRNSAPK